MVVVVVVCGVLPGWLVVGDCTPAQFLERVERSRRRAEDVPVLGVVSLESAARARVAHLKAQRHFLMTRSRERRQLLIEVAGSVDLRRWC